MKRYLASGFIAILAIANLGGLKAKAQESVQLNLTNSTPYRITLGFGESTDHYETLEPGESKRFDVTEGFYPDGRIIFQAAYLHRGHQAWLRYRNVSSLPDFPIYAARGEFYRVSPGVVRLRGY